MSDWKNTEIGLIPEDWQYVPFQSVLSKPLRNGIYKSKEYHGQGTRVVNMGEIFAFDKLPSIEMSRIELSNDELEKSDVIEGDLLFARRSLVAEGAGKCTLVLSQKEPLTFESSIIRARTNFKKANPTYLLYFFSSRIGKYLLKTILRQVAVSGITGTDLARLKLPLPNLEEQIKVSNLLSCLDRKIENLRKQNETLEAIAQTLFKHWFIDFEFPNADGKPYKSSGGAMEPSELGEIPVGWRVGCLRDITRVINGRAYKQTEFKEEGTPIVRIQNLTGKGQTVYSDLTLDRHKYISKGDLIYAWSATFGPYIWRGIKSIYHYHIWKLNCFSPAFKYYLYIHLKNVSDQVKGQGTGSIFTHITKELMESQELFIPDDKVMEIWHNLAKLIFDKIMLNHEQIETLTQIRDVLLPKLMSGKLRITSRDS